MERIKHLLALLAIFGFARAANSVVIITNTDNYNDRAFISSFESPFKQMLIANGILVFDLGQLSRVKEDQLTNQLLRGDTQAAIQLGLAYKADWVVTNKLQSSLVLRKEVGPITAYTYRASANTTVIAVSTAQIVFSHSDQAIGLGASSEEARSKAYAELGSKLAKSVAASLKSSSSSNIQVSLTISGLSSFSSVATLMKEIKHISGVTSAERKNYRDGVLEAIVMYSGDLDEFAAALENLPLTRLTLKEVEGHAITALVSGE